MKCVADNICSLIHEAYNVISGDVCSTYYALLIAPQPYILLHHFLSLGTSVCYLNESASTFKTVLISFITTDFCLMRLQANKLKSHLLSSQSLLHKPCHCSVELSPHLWANYWNMTVMAKLLNELGNMYNRSI